MPCNVSNEVWGLNRSSNTAPIGNNAVVGSSWCGTITEWGYRSTVGRVVRNDQIGVRFPLAPPKFMKSYALGRRDKTYSDGVPRDHRKNLSKLKVKDRCEHLKTDRKYLKEKFDL